MSPRAERRRAALVVSALLGGACGGEAAPSGAEADASADSVTFIDSVEPPDATQPRDVAVPVDTVAGLDGVEPSDTQAPRDIVVGDTSDIVTPVDAPLTSDVDNRDTTTGDATAPERRSRRIFMNVGARETCWRYDISGCEVVQFDYDLAHGTASRGSVVVSGGSAAPAVSPDGKRLAYDVQDGRRLTTHVLDLTSGANVAMESASNKPSWLDLETVIFGAQNITLRTDESSRWSDVAKQRVPDTSVGGTIANPYSSVRVLGAVNSETGLSSYDCGGEDPWPVPGRPGWVAIHSQVWRFEGPTTPTLEHTCPWVVGLDPYRDKKDPRPVVIDTNATAWQEGVTWERVDTATAGITGCAHLSVAPSGQHILCTNQPDVTVVRDPIDGVMTKFNDMYGFRRVGNSWVSVRPNMPLFDHLAPRELPDAESIWAPGKSCHVYRTKQGSFCGDDDLIATDVYCEDTTVDPQNPDQVFARAFLIDIRDPEAPIYMDLTSALEDARGLARGTLGAYTLSCAPGDPRSGD
jgi:hypothetical protein